MTTFAFIELPPPLDGWISVPNAMFPVQSQLANDLTRANAPDPERILFDLEQYLVEHPDTQPRYAPAGAQLAFRTAVELFTNGLREQSLQFYEMSLRLRPDDFITRYNYAVALHALCYRDAALAEYQRLMTSTTPQEQLRLWILAAQIHLHHKNYRDVVRLLEPLSETLFPQDGEFWEALGNARTALGETKSAARAPSAVAGRCASCGGALKPTSKFCPLCGRPVAAPPPAAAAPSTAAGVCRHCGQPRRPGSKFCGSCGKP